MKKILFALTLFLTSCGYQAVNKIDKTNFIISKYDFLGNSQINKILKRNFDKNKKNDNLQNEFEIIVNSKLIKSNNSKNRAGEVTNLTIQIIVDLEISQYEKKIKNLSFVESNNYNNNDNKFELKQFEKIIINDLVDKIIRRINLDLSSIK